MFSGIQSSYSPQVQRAGAKFSERLFRSRAKRASRAPFTSPFARNDCRLPNSVDFALFFFFFAYTIGPVCTISLVTENDALTSKRSASSNPGLSDNELTSVWREVIITTWTIDIGNAQSSVTESIFDRVYNGKSPVNPFLSFYFSIIVLANSCVKRCV